MAKRLLAFFLVAAVLFISALPSGALASSSEVGPDGIAIPPGGTRLDNQVMYDDGAVILEFAPQNEQAAPLTVTRCPLGWFCLFEHANWAGRMLKFQECCKKQYLSNYGFQNQASSWHNRLHKDVGVYDYTLGRLWCADSGGAQSAYVGATRNDKADYLYIHSTNTVC